MKTKHTEGQWIPQNWIKVKDQGDCPVEIRSSGAPGGRLVAELCFDNSDNELSAEKCRANAKLIADSPIMLDYIKKKALEGDVEAQKIAERHA